MNLELLAKEVIKRANMFQCGYADAWAYLINDREKSGFTFAEVNQYIKNKLQQNNPIS